MVAPVPEVAMVVGLASAPRRGPVVEEAPGQQKQKESLPKMSRPAQTTKNVQMG